MDSEARVPSDLPAELELALRSATWRALIALESLRVAVRDHVRSECSHGASRDEVNDGLRSMIDWAGPALDHEDYSAGRADDVTKQVLKWSATYFQPRI